MQMLFDSEDLSDVGLEHSELVFNGGKKLLLGGVVRGNSGHAGVSNTIKLFAIALVKLI